MGRQSPCLITQCLDNTAAYFDPRDDPPGLKFIPLFFPIFMVVLAGVSLLLDWKCPALTLSICSLILVPFLFTATAFVFPLAVGVADTCASFESIVINIAPIVSPKICNLLGGGNRTAYSYNVDTGLCTFDVNQLNSTFRIKPSEAIRSVVDNCKGEGTAGLAAEAIDDFWLQVGTRAQPHVQSVLREILRNATAALQIRPALNLAFSNAIDGLGGDASSTVNELRSVLSCQSLHAIYKSAKEAGCCEIGGPLYWHAVFVVLTGLCAMCCGGPGGFLAFRHEEIKREFVVYARSRLETDRHVQRQAFNPGRELERQRSRGFGTEAPTTDGIEMPTIISKR